MAGGPAGERGACLSAETHLKNLNKMLMWEYRFVVNLYFEFLPLE